MPPFEEADPISPTSQTVGPNHEPTVTDPDEVAHVLFLDIVGFTRLLPVKQVIVLGKLQEIVSATENFRSANRPKELIALPTGDGMALAFLTGGVSGVAISCAEKIAEAILSYNEITSDEDAKLHVRMGIHSGTVVRIRDINDSQNVAGEGINTAQRVMDCGDEGHILLSDTAFQLRPKMHDRTEQFASLGNVRVKHDKEVNLYSFSQGGIGNQRLPTVLLKQRQEAEARFAQLKPLLDKEARKHRLQWLLTALVVVVLIAATYFVTRTSQASDPPVTLYVSVFKPQTPQRYSSRALSKALRQDFTRSFRFLAPQQSMNPSVETADPTPSASAQALTTAEAAIAIGRQMGVRYVLTGTVESDLENGDRSKLASDDPDFTITVNIELHDTESGSVWPKRYEATKFSGVISLENSVMNDVCARLKVSCNRSRDDDPETLRAHWDYVAGRFWAFQRANADEKDKSEFTEKAKRFYYLARDSRKDPYYALALAGLADIKLSEGGLGQNPKDAAKEALALLLDATAAAQNKNNEVAEPYAAVGTQKWWLQRDFLGAITAFQLAIRIDFNLADSHKRYSSCLAVLNKAREAEDEMNIALQMEPESPVFQLASAQNYVFARNYSKAIEQLRNLISTQAKNNERTDPAAYRFLAVALERAGKGQEALNELELAEKDNKVRSDDPDVLSVKAHILARVGREPEAVKIAEDLERRQSASKNGQGYVPSYLIAVIYAPMKDKRDKTLDYLNRAKEEFDPRLTWLNVDPRFKEWKERKEEMFTVLLVEVGLLPPSTNRVPPVNTALR